MRESLWKFYLVGWTEKKKNLFIKICIGYDDSIQKYQNKSKDVQSLSKSKSLFPDLQIDSQEAKMELNKIADTVIAILSAKQLIPSLLSVHIISSDLQNKSKCRDGVN